MKNNELVMLLLGIATAAMLVIVAGLYFNAQNHPSCVGKCDKEKVQL